MRINKFWAKLKMVMIGISLMSLLSLVIFIVHTVLFKVPSIIFLIIAVLSSIIAIYANYRRRLELSQ
jgi:hypothetical protein